MQETQETQKTRVKSLGVRKIPWRKKCQLTPVFLPGKSHGQRSPVGYSPGGRKELDMTERLRTAAESCCKVFFSVSWVIFFTLLASFSFFSSVMLQS